MKNLLFVLITVFAVSCTTFSGHQTGHVVTKNGTEIKFKNARIVTIEKDVYILGEQCQYYIKEKHIKSLTFNK